MSDSTILHEEWYTWIGQGVSVSKENTGTLKYFGEIQSKSGFWCGVELDEPIGNSDGVICNVQYFKCKTNRGVFVPVHEVTMLKTRSVELNCVSTLSKLKFFEDKDGLCNAANKKMQAINFTGNLDKTFDVNVKNESKHVNFVEDKRYVNTCKRSKNSAGRFGTEESLGILSSLLEEDGSWNLLDHSNAISEQCDIQNISDDSVFSPPVKAPLPNKKKSYSYAKHINNPIQNGLSIKCTSTPKNCLNNVFDLGATVKLNDDQFCDFLENEIEPIIAGSTNSKLMDLDLTKFEENDILCSTSKLCIPVLPPEVLVLDKENYIKSEDFNDDKKLKDILSTSTTSHDCIGTSEFIHGRGKPENLDILNTTYKIDPELLINPIASISTNVEGSCLELGLNVNSGKKYDAVIDLNSTFVMPDNYSVKDSNHVDRTFIIDCSPEKVIEQTLSPEPDLIFEKKSLSIIFEKASSENLSKIGAAECIDELFSTSDSTLKRNNYKNINSPKHFSESIDKLMHSLNSTRIMNNEEFASDLNSTFFLNVDESKRDKNAYQDASKRNSLSSLSEKNNTPAYKKNSNIATRKSIKPPESFFSKKTVPKTLNSHSATKHTKDIKNPTVNALSSKKIEDKNKNIPKDTSRSCSKLSSGDNLKVKCSSPAIASMTKNFRKTLNPCKVSYSKNVLEKNTPHLALKITKNDSKISTTRRKSFASVETKAIPNMSYNSKKIGMVNGKVNMGAGSSKINTRNQIVATHSTITRRHTMLPAILANENHAKISLCKSKSDISNGTTTVAKSTIAFTNNKGVQSLKIPQCGIGNKKEDFRENFKKSVPAGRVRTPGNNSKDSTKSEDIKYENITIPKRGLLKPGMLSRLPVLGKSIKKPVCIPNAVNPQQNIKNNKDDKGKNLQRLPFRKLQDQYS